MKHLCHWEIAGIRLATNRMIEELAFYNKSSLGSHFGPVIDKNRVHFQPQLTVIYLTAFANL